MLANLENSVHVVLVQLGSPSAISIGVNRRSGFGSFFVRASLAECVFICHFVLFCFVVGRMVGRAGFEPALGGF